MSHGPEHQIEHAEHAAHAAHNEYDKRVTISIAIIAAVLACVTMLGHRAHNETLRLQAESGKLSTEASNTWARYQAVNVRYHLYRISKDQNELQPAPPELKSRQEEIRQGWQGQLDKYEKKQLPELEKEAREQTAESKVALARSEEMHARSDRFDLGELGLQLGVVLSSLAILTRGRLFWYAGLLCALAGAVLAVTGYVGLFMGAHH